jgi:hypothetical protein
MTALLTMRRSVKIDGLTGEWIIREKDTKECNGVKYVKVSKEDSSLSSLLGNVGGYFCLRRSIGFRNLVELRNEQLKPAVEATCTLFDDVPEQPDRASKSRPVYESRAPDGSCVALEVGGATAEIKVLLATHRCSMFVAFEAETIQTVIKYFLEAGFDPKKVKTKRNADDAEMDELPAGVWRYPKGYSVAYTHTDGRKCRKYMRNLCDALKFHANPNDDDSSAEEDNEEL